MSPLLLSPDTRESHGFVTTEGPCLTQYSTTVLRKQGNPLTIDTTLSIHYNGHENISRHTPSFLRLNR